MFVPDHRKNGVMEQYVRQPPLSEKQVEWMQEQLFRESGPFYHLYTKPLESDVLFRDDEERKAAINFIGILVKEVSIDLLAFALMSNHFHFIFRGDEMDAIAFFQRLKERLSRFFSRNGRPGIMNQVTADVTCITSLKQLRDEIAYVIRNPYVVRTDVNPLAWLWCSGYLYFNPLLAYMITSPADELTYREKKAISHSREGRLPEGLLYRDGMLLPESFVNYRLVEQLFPNSRKFTLWVFKNIEAQIEVANRLGEKPNLSDDDLIRTTFQLSRRHFGTPEIHSLDLQQKKELALILKNNYDASNGQIARCTRMDIQIVNALFPLAAKVRPSGVQ